MPIKAITLVIISLCILLALIAKFDFETLQFDAVNICVYADFNKIVFIKMSSKYSKQDKIFKLNKALYSLQ